LGSGGAQDIATNRKRIGFAAVLTGGFMVAEVVGGLIAGSLALIADAGHMLSDFAGLVLAWYAFRIANRQPTQRMSYGIDRFQVLAAFVNGMTLVFLCIWIVVEAVTRLLDPVEVLSGTMMVIAILGLGVNIVSFIILSGADKNNLNVRGATLHVLGDILGSVAAIAAAGIIMATGWMIADPILSVLVALIILRSAYLVIRGSGHILLEGTPEFLDPREIDDDLTATLESVVEVHHIHAWSITQARTVATLHAKVAEGAAADQVTADVKARLKKCFGIAHATVEIEFDDCADEQVKSS
jgi:cobalt-zinc-cadmium efflux system protein